MRWFRKGADTLGVVLFSALFAVFMVQIAARFAFNRPLPWTDEAAVVLYVWVILWAAAFIVPEREHVMFDLVWNASRRRTRQAMRITGNLMVGGLAAWAIPACWDYVQFMAREGTPVLGVPFMWVFLRSAVNIWRAARGLDLGDADLPVT